MAIITAEAKLYNGIRLLCVDVNAQGTFTSTFASNVDNLILRLAESNFTAGTFTFNLVDERYLTYGGASEMETSTASLECKFPTYIRFDLEALGVPEGVDIILQLEEGFLFEGDYVGSNNSPLAKVDNLLQFRTPIKGAANLTASFTLSYDEIELTTPFEAVITAQVSPFVVTANLSPASAFSFPSAIAIIEAVGNANFILQPTIINAETAINIPIVPTLSHGRLRFGDIAMVEDASAMVTDNKRIRFNDSVMSSTTTMTTVAVKTTEILLSSQGFGTMTTVAVKTARIVGEFNNNVNINVNAVKTTDVIKSLNVESSMIIITDLTLIMQTNLNNEDYLGLNLSNTVPGISVPVGFVGLSDPINVTVDWGDGTTDTYTTQQWADHTYSQHGEYTVRIIADKDLDGLGSAYNQVRPAWHNAVKEIRCWGVNTFVDDGGADDFFLNYLCARVPYENFQVPDWLPNITQADVRLDGFLAQSLANPSNIANWDLNANYRTIFLGNGRVFNFNVGMFVGATNFNQPIGNWDISKLTFFGSPSYFFDNNTNFNQDLGNWYNIDTSYMINGINYTLYLNLHETNISEENFNKSLIGWANRRSSSGFSAFLGYITIPSDVSATSTTYGSGTYTTGATAKTYLENQGWVFISRTRFLNF